MPLYNPAIKSIDLNELKRYSGLATCKEFPQHLLDQACTEAQILTQPKAVWKIYDYDKDSSTIMSPEPLPLPPSAVSRHLAASLKVAVIAVTIGAKLEETVSDYFTKNEYTRGLLLDAAGTTAVELAADQACEFMNQEVNKKGYIAVSRFSPGYGGWDIKVQPQIVSLAHAKDIQITSTPSCMLLPRKSITAVIGLIANTCQNSFTNTIKDAKCGQCQQINCFARKDDKE